MGQIVKFPDNSEVEIVETEPLEGQIDNEVVSAVKHIINSFRDAKTIGSVRKIV